MEDKTKLASPSDLMVPNVNAEIFRAAMRRVASTVFVLTTEIDQTRWGLTATAVCSLSTEPPSLIVCINNKAQALPAINESRRICINVISEDDLETAQRFTGMLGHSGEERFGGSDWYYLSTGAPALRSAAAVFDCTIVDRSHIATHSILTCIVQSIAVGAETSPLLYLNGRYARVV
jgi:flavin reductase